MRAMYGEGGAILYVVGASFSLHFRGAIADHLVRRLRCMWHSSLEGQLG